MRTRDSQVNQILVQQKRTLTVIKHIHVLSEMIVTGMGLPPPLGYWIGPLILIYYTVYTGIEFIFFACFETSKYATKTSLFWLGEKKLIFFS